MRMLLWGIITVCGLALIGCAIDVHGSRDERAAIKRAVRAPSADLRRRNARALCQDFTPAVDAHLAPGRSSDCEAQVRRLFHVTQDAAEYVPPRQRPLPARLKVMNISWDGDHATATTGAPGAPAGERRWRLEMLGHRWRIATPTKLEMRSDCQHHLFGTQACAYVMWLRVAAP